MTLCETCGRRPSERVGDESEYIVDCPNACRDLADHAPPLLEALEKIAAARAAPVDTGHPAATLLVVAKDEYDHLRDAARAAILAAKGGE